MYEIISITLFSLFIEILNYVASFFHITRSVISSIVAM